MRMPIPVSSPSLSAATALSPARMVSVQTKAGAARARRRRATPVATQIDVHTTSQPTTAGAAGGQNVNRPTSARAKENRAKIAGA